VVDTIVRDVPGLAASLCARDGGFSRIYYDDRAIAEAVDAARRLIDGFSPDLVVATTPSFRNVELGYRVAEATGVPLVIDWRDPGALRPLRMWSSRRYYEAHCAREAEWVARAAMNIATAHSSAVAAVFRVDDRGHIRFRLCGSLPGRAPYREQAYGWRPLPHGSRP
jgi:hypothetical protein